LGRLDELALFIHALDAPAVLRERELEEPDTLAEGHGLALAATVHPRALHPAEEAVEALALGDGRRVAHAHARRVGRVLGDEDPGAGLAHLGDERRLVAAGHVVELGAGHLEDAAHLAPLVDRLPAALRPGPALLGAALLAALADGVD